MIIVRDIPVFCSFHVPISTAHHLCRQIEDDNRMARMPFSNQHGNIYRGSKKHLKKRRRLKLSVTYPHLSVSSCWKCESSFSSKEHRSASAYICIGLLRRKIADRTTGSAFPDGRFSTLEREFLLFGLFFPPYLVKRSRSRAGLRAAERRFSDRTLGHQRVHWQTKERQFITKSLRVCRRQRANGKPCSLSCGCHEG